LDVPKLSSVKQDKTEFIVFGNKDVLKVGNKDEVLKVNAYTLRKKGSLGFYI